MRRTPDLSIVVVAYNMDRELPRTLLSLSRSMQRDVGDIEYEIVLVDNGSDAPIRTGALEVSQVIRVEDATVSPAPAANRGIEACRADLIGVMVDGARLASPGLVAKALEARRLHDRAVIATLNLHLGREAQQRSVPRGYDAVAEDELLRSSGWEQDGYRLFDIGVTAPSSRRGWFGPLLESNALFMSGGMWAELGGFDERFESAGGGWVNHDTFRRSLELPSSRLVVLLGEGTFHQVHGGASTSGDSPKREEWAREYQAIRGEPIRMPEIRPHYLGDLPDPAARKLWGWARSTALPRSRTAARTSTGPLFSVLLPTHNRADVVGHAIDSVLSQTETDFELLVVGDGCTDGTAQVVKSFGDRRIRWYDLPKAPHFGYANRNQAIRGARGELLAFMAHDDIMLPDHLGRLAAYFEDERIELAYSRPLWVSDDGFVVPYAVDLRRPHHLEVFLEDHNTIPATCVVYRRSTHERVGGWPEDVVSGGDWKLWRSIVGQDKGLNVAYEPDPTALHFRASWRSHTQWGPPPLSAWLERARGGWWPPSLRVSVPGDQNAQAAFSDLRATRRFEWVDELRDGVREALEELAWESGDGLARIHPVAAGEAPIPAGDAETARKNPLFDEAWYRAQYRDCGASDAYAHWRSHAREGRNPNPYFDTDWYLHNNPDVQASGIDPLDHYYLYGGREGRAPSPRFDSAWYLARYIDVAQSGENPLHHYVRIGGAEGRLPREPESSG
jgi:glycosyltransferase involved in cell wall biosynthesis